MDRSSQPVELLTDVKRNKQELTVVEVAAALEDAGDRQLGGQYHLTNRVDVTPLRILGSLLLKLEFIQLLDDLAQIPRGIDGKDISHMDAECSSKLGSDHRAVAAKIQLAGDDELGEITHLELESRLDPPDLRGETLVVELHDHRPLDKRGYGHHSRGLF